MFDIKEPSGSWDLHKSLRGWGLEFNIRRELWERGQLLPDRSPASGALVPLTHPSHWWWPRWRGCCWPEARSSRNSTVGSGQGLRWGKESPTGWKPGLGPCLSLFASGPNSMTGPPGHGGQEGASALRTHSLMGKADLCPVGVLENRSVPTPTAAQGWASMGLWARGRAGAPGASGGHRSPPASLLPPAHSHRLPGISAPTTCFPMACFGEALTPPHTVSFPGQDLFI